MSKSKLLDIRISVENVLYEHTTDNTTIEDMEEIRNVFNSVVDDFIKENKIEKR